MQEKLNRISRKVIRLGPFYFLAARKAAQMRSDKLKYPKKPHEIISYSIKHVPYYRNQYSALLKEKNLSLDSFAFLRKTDIIGREEEFISDRALGLLLMKKSTGGTTGLSLNLQKNLASVIWEIFFTDQIFFLISPVKIQKTAILRALLSGKSRRVTFPGGCQQIIRPE